MVPLMVVTLGCSGQEDYQVEKGRVGKNQKEAEPTKSAAEAKAQGWEEFVETIHKLC